MFDYHSLPAVWIRSIKKSIILSVLQPIEEGKYDFACLQITTIGYCSGISNFGITKK